MDPAEEFGIILDDLESDSDSEADIGPPSDSETENEESEVSNKSQGNSIGARVQALTLFELQVPYEEITAQTGVSRSGLYKLRSKAISRGWDPSGILETWHVDDAPRSGRPKISTALILFIIQTMTKNSTTRGWPSWRIAAEVSNIPGQQPVSQSTVYRVLIDNGYSSFKRTVKLGLTNEQKAARLRWCLIYEHWTIKDQKNVIFTDETSVQMGSVRGKQRVQRKKEETFHPHIITRRWKGFSEFMWQSCFSFDIWEDETPAEKRKCKADLAARNAERYKKDKEEWEMAYSIH